MRVLPLHHLLLATLWPLLVVGCAETSGTRDFDGYSSWKAVYGGAPAEWRFHRYGDSQFGYWDVIEIKNTSNQKLDMVVLATYKADNQFIDLQQPGAARLSLYPNQVCPPFIVDGNKKAPSLDTTVYLKVQDYKLSN